MLSDQQFSTASFVALGLNEELENRIKSLEDIAASISPLMSGPSTLLQAFLEQRIVFQRLFNAGTFVTKMDGIAIADFPLSSRIGVSYMDRDFMLTVLEEGKTTISRPVMGKKLAEPLFAVAVPIRNAQGKVIGSLVGGTDLSKPNFLDKIWQNNYGKTGGYLLVAPQYRLFITGTDKSYTMQPLPAPGTNPLLDRYNQGFEGSGIVVDSRGKEVLSSAKQIPIAGWFVVARVPTIEAFAPIHNMQRKMLLMTIFTTLLAGGFTWWMLRRQLAPMFEAVTTLAVMADSGLQPQPLPVVRQDEIGKLIGGFNGLLKTLVQREEAQVKNEERFRRVSSLISDVAYSCSLDSEGYYSIEWMTGATEKICGYSVEEITARKCWRFLVEEEDLPQFDQNTINLTPGSQRLCNLRIRHKNGNVVWITSAAECVIVPGTLNSTLLYGCFVDITERKRAEGALLESAEKYQLLFNSANDAIFIHDRQGQILEVNHMACKRLGYNHAELTTMTVGKVDMPEEATHALERMTQVMEQGYLTFEARHRCKDDTPLAVEISSRQIIWEGQSAIMSICRDISERKQTEDYREIGREIEHILNESGDQHNSIQQVLAVLKNRTGFDAVGIRLQEGEDYPYLAQEGFSAEFLLKENTLLDRTADNNLCRGNDGNVMLVGTCGEVISGSIDSTNPFFTPTGSFWVNDSTLLLDIPFNSAHRFCRRNQCIYHNYASFALVPLRNKENIIGLIHFADHRRGCFTINSIEILEGIASYIGATLMRKQAEEENKSLQVKLFQAQKMEAIGTLAGGIAHDFNNILGAILGYAEIARDDTPPGSSVINSLDKVLEASQRAVGLVKQILAFSRQEKIEHVPLKLSHIVKEATKLLRSSIPSTIEIRQQTDVVTRLILADPTQVHQILMNLGTNAYHAMEHSGGIIQITLKDCELSQCDLHQHPEVKPGSFVVLSVSDTGTGIDPDIWGRIFDPYFTTKEVGKGTGMGLSIVHGIITSYGGFITSKNNSSNGTVFNVYFPAIEQEIITDDKPIEAVPSGTGHILLIDDEVMLADLGQAILERLGYEVTMLTSSLEALAVFKNEPDRFDAVVTDQTMPGMTGMDLARKMLQIRPDLPVILCTGYSSLVNEEQANVEGIMGFAMKPLRMNVIANLLRDALDHEKTLV